MMYSRPKRPSSVLLLLALTGIACAPIPSEVSGTTASTGADSGSPGSSTGDGGLGSGTEAGSDSDDDPGPSFEPVCGDGIIEDDEQCDLGENNGLGDYCTGTCRTNVCGDGYQGPGEACDDGNNVDGDDCTTQCGLPTCGDGVVQMGEDCDDGEDGNSEQGPCLPSCVMARCGDQSVQSGEVCDSEDVGGQTCVSQGFDQGTLVCGKDCTSFDVSSCSACGNDILELTEQCDGDDFRDNLTCEDFAPAGSTVSGGGLECTGACEINPNPCSFCGDNESEVPEVCDGTDLNSRTCVDEGFDGGVLACAADCSSYDHTGCTTITCGDGLVEGDEECEVGILGDETCVTQGFAGGTLTCTGCMFDTSMCTAPDPCGNGIIDADEECDTDDLNGATCETEYGVGTIGELACDESCMFDPGDCCRVIGGGCANDSHCCSNNCEDNVCQE